MSEMWEEIMLYHLSGYFATWYATAVNLLDKSSVRGSQVVLSSYCCDKDQNLQHEASPVAAGPTSVCCQKY